MAHAFGRYPGVHFDGLDDKLIIPDAASLHLGTDTFVLELVLFNETRTCCQQMIFAKEELSGQYRGVTIAVNWWEPPSGNTAYPSTGEFAAFTQFSNAAVTPFGDGVDYRDAKPRLLSAVRTANTLAIRVNGQELASVAEDATMVSAEGDDLIVGGHPLSDQLQFQGAIAEIVYARSVSSQEAWLIEQDLLAKYQQVLASP